MSPGDLERIHSASPGEVSAILSIKRDEPASSLFEVPAGYKIVDMTPPQNAPVASSPIANQGH